PIRPMIVAMPIHGSKYLIRLRLSGSSGVAFSRRRLDLLGERGVDWVPNQASHPALGVFGLAGQTKPLNFLAFLDLCLMDDQSIAAASRFRSFLSTGLRDGHQWSIFRRTVGPQRSH